MMRNYRKVCQSLSCKKSHRCNPWGRSDLWTRLSLVMLCKVMSLTLTN